MKVSRIILRGVGSFEDFDRSFVDSWTETVPNSLVLIGTNGSGKTTIVRAISSLWDKFVENFLRVQRYFLIHPDSQFFNSQLVAMEIIDLISEPLWIYFGSEVGVSRFLNEQKESYKVGGSWQGQTHYVYFEYTPPDHFAHLAQRWIDDLRERFIEKDFLPFFPFLSTRHTLPNLPNLITVPSENRAFNDTLTSKISDISLALPFNKYELMLEDWLGNLFFEVLNYVRLYRPLVRFINPPKNMGLSKKLEQLDQETRQHVLKDANEFFTDKKVVDSNGNGLLVQTKSGKTHSLKLLSSGERHLVFMLTRLINELRRGGIVLIDEPDLYLHVSLSAAFVRHIENLVIEQNGQLIIATHSPTVWKSFNNAYHVPLGYIAEVLKR